MKEVCLPSHNRPAARYLMFQLLIDGIVRCGCPQLIIVFCDAISCRSFCCSASKAASSACGSASCLVSAGVTFYTLRHEGRIMPSPHAWEIWNVRCKPIVTQCYEPPKGCGTAAAALLVCNLTFMLLLLMLLHVLPKTCQKNLTNW